MKNARIFLFFLIAAIVGTIAHEFGHAIVGEIVGFNTRMTYAFTYCENCFDIYNAAKDAEALHQYQYKQNLFIWGGPLQTILTGVAGIVLLLFIRRKEAVDAYDVKHLFALTLSFFISRNVFNEVLFWAKYFTAKELPYRCDECKLLSYYNINPLIGHLTILIVASAVLCWITFGLLKKHRIQFILWGGLGSLTGGLLWLYLIGEHVMP